MIIDTKLTGAERMPRSRRRRVRVAAPLEHHRPQAAAQPKTITFDNGTEFHDYARLKQRFPVKVNTCRFVSSKLTSVALAR